MSKKNYIRIKMIKRNGTLVPCNSAESTLFKEFVNSMDEYQLAFTLFETDSSDGTALQKSRIHATIKDIATDQQIGFNEVKYLIKDRSGLRHPDGTYTSFADCSKEELSRVIYELETVCNALNIPIV